MDQTLLMAAFFCGLTLLVITASRRSSSKLVAWTAARRDKLRLRVHRSDVGRSPPWFAETLEATYANGTILPLTPHQPPPALAPLNHLQRSQLNRLARVRPSDRAKIIPLVRGAEQGAMEEGCWRTFFGRDAFHEPWPRALEMEAPESTRSATGLISTVWRFFQNLLAFWSTSANVPSHRKVTIVSPLWTGMRPSQLFLVRSEDFPSSFLVAKIYDPYFFNAEDAIATHPVIFTKTLYETEVSVFRHIQRQHGQLPVPQFYGSFEAQLPKDGRPVYVVLMEYIPGCTLRELPRNDVHMRKRILSAAIKADQALLQAGILQTDLACRNFILRTDGEVVMVDFGVAGLSDDGGSVKVDLVKRWANNQDFRCLGWIPSRYEGGDPEGEIVACLEMDAAKGITR